MVASYDVVSNSISMTRAPRANLVAATIGTCLTDKHTISGQSVLTWWSSDKSRAQSCVPVNFGPKAYRGSQATTLRTACARYDTFRAWCGICAWPVHAQQSLSLAEYDGNTAISLYHLTSVRDGGDQGINDRRRRDVVIVDCERRDSRAGNKLLVAHATSFPYAPAIRSDTAALMSRTVVPPAQWLSRRVVVAEHPLHYWDHPGNLQPVKLQGQSLMRTHQRQPTPHQTILCPSAHGGAAPCAAHG